MRMLNDKNGKREGEGKKEDRRKEGKMEGGPHTMLNFYLHHLMLLCGLRKTSNFKIKEMSRGQIVNLWIV